jgi:hypothetical protein
MHIRQIIEVKDFIFGLGDDEKMYRWDFKSASWMPYWNQGSSEDAQPRPEGEVPPAL